MRPAARRRSPVLLALLAALLAVLLVAAGCSSSGGDDDGASDSGGDSEAGSSFDERGAPAEAEADMPSGSRDRRNLSADSLSTFDSTARRPANDVTGRKIIAKGNVSLESDDVARTVFHVQEVADQRGGEITERATTTNKDGDVSTARLLLRIPVAEFDRAFTGLQEVADLKSADTGKEDVTTKVIDTQVRIRAQRRSLSRVEALLDRAQSISDIIRIEGHLTHRQAELESLQRRLAYLSDQTSMSTISVNISLTPPEKEKKEKEQEEAGFLAGLEDGWKALKAFGTGTATVAGQVLPFAGVLLLIGIPVFLVRRRLWRRGGETPDVA